MKDRKNNQMDLLLRRIASWKANGSAFQEASVSAREDQVFHLDPDELSLYAEGVLPPPARARYTAHIADCGRCRGIVIQLAAAAGKSMRENAIERQRGLSFWRKLSVFLSPPALRYLVPGLAIVTLVVIGIVSLRQQQRAQFLAQNQPSLSRPPSSGLNETQPKTQPENGAAPTAASKPLIKSSPTTPTEENKKANSSNKVEIGQVAGAVDSTSVAQVKDLPRSQQTPAVTLQPSFAPEPAMAPPPAAPRPTFAQAARGEEIAKEKEQASGQDTTARQREDEKARAKDDAAEDRVAAAKTESTASRNMRGLRAREAGKAGAADGRLEKDKKAANESETRSVAGRHFRRQGSAWVDTAYDSASTTINVARGSEQYRALVADEPGIRTIADQLDGEVIVVWKGRPYRIR